MTPITCVNSSGPQQLDFKAPPVSPGHPILSSEKPWNISTSSDLVHRIREMVVLRNGFTAIEAPEGRLSYRDVEELSNRLAHRLIAMGVTNRSRVGISLPRGARELLAILATAKAGGAYVPLDPSHPLDRLRGIVEDSAPQVLVTTAHSPMGSLPGISKSVLLLDDLAQAMADYPGSPPAVTLDGQQLAYILFTSGSTGRPKGVEITHSAFANFLGSMAHTPGMTHDERLLAITTTSFDIAGLELFLPLWVGATVVIVDKETARDPRALKLRLENDTVSIMQATPATWRLLLEAGWRPSKALRMLCGGEAMCPALANRLLESGGELWNLYGPTETTVWSSLERIQPGFDRITIGRPIDNTTLMILDEAFCPVLPGSEGEIWIGGHGLARGYFQRPDLTAERFIQVPDGKIGDRIYRTGDLGRQLADGRFECLGRLDHQVKIRGFRIELGEIETILRTVPGVFEALVLADQPDIGEPRLIAYWTGNASREDLLTKAHRNLPTYMVPSAYVPLDSFPLNTNGKIDRKKLPQPEDCGPYKSPDNLPRNDFEARIAEVWCEFLRVREVGIDQDFFDLGGTSLLAVQLVTRLEQEVNIAISLQSFYEEPTVKGIAAHLESHFSPDDPIVIRLHAGEPNLPPLWCVCGVSIYQYLSRALGTGQTVYGVHIPTRYLPGRAPQPTITEIAQRYVDLIKKKQEQGPYHLLGICYGGVIAHEIARLFESQGKTIALVTILDAVLPTAMVVDRIKRLRALVKSVWDEPKRIRARLVTIGQKLIFRVPILAKIRDRFIFSEPTTEPIEISVASPEFEAAVTKFALQPKRLSSPILIIRATQEPPPSWMRVAPDYGWGPFCSQVFLLDIAATHLEVLKDPHVRSLAKAIALQSKIAS